MPVLNVTVNKNFDEVVQGRGYLGNTSGSVSGKLPNGEFSIVKQDERYVKVRGKFTSTGVKFAEAVGKDGKSAYFLFNVMDDPSPTSAKGVVFTDSKPKAEFSIIRKGVNYTDNISSPFITSEPTIELELIDKSAPYYDIVKWEWCIWDGQNWKVISRSKDVKYTVSSSDSIATFKLKVTNSKGVESNSITHCMYISK